MLEPISEIIVFWTYVPEAFEMFKQETAKFVSQGLIKGPVDMHDLLIPLSVAETDWRHVLKVRSFPLSYIYVFATSFTPPPSPPLLTQLCYESLPPPGSLAHCQRIYRTVPRLLH